MKKNISNTFVYDILNISKSIERIIELNKGLEKYALKKVYIDQLVHDIKFKINFPAKAKIIEMVESGSIIFVEESGVVLPTWSVSNSKGEITTTVVNLFGKIKTKDDIISFNAREVFGLAQMGLVMRSFYMYESKLVYNTTLVSAACTVYVRMISKIIDTLFSIETIPLVAAQVKFIIAKFFFLYVLERENNETVEQLAYKACNTGITLDALKSISGKVDPSTYESFPGLIKGMSEEIMYIKDLDVSSLMRKMIMSYGEKSLLMLENYNYFLAIVLNISISGGYVKDYSMETITGVQGMTIYNSFFDLAK